MEDEETTFGVQPDRLDRLVFEAMAEPEDRGQGPATASLAMLVEKVGGWIDRYKLLSVLGEGGMGIVYLAEQNEPIHRQVALKVIKPGMDTRQVIGRFEAERQALAMMDHPNIAKVLDAGTTQSGRPYFVMELVKGTSITQYADEHHLSPRERLELFVPVCHAVQHAHQKGIIHRDLKPSNILVSGKGDNAMPKIIDFGVAKAIGQPLSESTLFTEDGHLLGTPEYMSPEQADIANEDIDTRSDIYSLGVLLYVLLAGILPFDSKMFRRGGLEHIRKMICEADPKTPSTRLGEISVADSIESARRRSTGVKALQRRLHGDLDWITLKAMEKDRTQRHGSAGELAADVRRHLNHEPVSAGRPSTVYRLKKFVRRHKGPVTGTLAVLAVSLLGTLVSTVLAIGQARARAEAQAVSDFLLKRVLTSLDLWDMRGQEITVRSVLDAASQGLEGEFAGAPLVEASIRWTLAASYTWLGLYEPAELHAQRALEIRRARLGDDHIETLLSAYELGWLYFFQSRYSEAERLLSTAREGMKEGHPARPACTAVLGWVYNMWGRFPEAQRLFEGSLSTIHRVWGEENERSPTILNGLAFAHQMQGRYEEAERLANRALEISRRVRGESDWETLNAMCIAGNLCRERGRYGQAEQLLVEALEGTRRVRGEQHSHTLWAMRDLARLYSEQGRDDEAEQLFSKTLEGMRRVRGRDHEETLGCMNGLAVLYAKQKRYDEAETLFNTALEGRRSRLGEDHHKTLETVNDFGVLRREQHRYSEAESLLRQALEGRQRKLGPHHPACFESMHELAVLYIRQARYGDAEPLLLDAFHGREAKLGPKHPHTIESLKQLVTLYESWGKPDEAAKWRAKLVPLDGVEKQGQRSVRRRPCLYAK